MTPVLGIDPGGKYTGVVLRRGPDLLRFHTVTRTCEGLPDAAYLETIALVVHGFLGTYNQPADRVRPLVAVEGLNEPNPYAGLTNVAGVIGTGMVLGSILVLFPAAIVVPPGQNGSGAMLAYPEQLRPSKGKGAGKDALRHCRSAWDVAGAAVGLARIGAA